MTESALLRATRWLSLAQAELHRQETAHARLTMAGVGVADLTIARRFLASARANVVSRRAEVERLEAEAGGAR